MIEMQFVSNSEPAPYHGVGDLDLPFNTFRLGRKWYDRIAAAEDRRIRAIIDGQPDPTLDLVAVAWLLGPLGFLAERFGHDAHSWRASDKTVSPTRWFVDRMTRAYGEPVTETSEVSAVFVRPRCRREHRL